MKKQALLGGLLASVVTMACAASPVHTWHTIIAKDSSWTGRLVITSANEPAYFTDKDGNNKGSLYDFTLNATAPVEYGFGFPDTVDFNVSYELTLYSASSYTSGKLGFTSPACQFNVTADAPAHATITKVAYNGAVCDFNIKNGHITYTATSHS